MTRKEHLGWRKRETRDRGIFMKIITDKSRANIWYRKPLSGCIASNGSPYNITLKKGSANNLLVNFMGGGLSWSEETAARPTTISRLIRNKESFYIPKIPLWQLNLIHIGLLNSKDSRNPLRDWNVLNIPYTTADFHIGNNEFPYKDHKGNNKMLHHNGAKNVDAALAVLKQYFPKAPDTLLIAGQSGGGFGCVAHAPKITSIYPGCNNIIVYSDGTHLHSPIWANTAANVWKVCPSLLAHITSNDLIVDLFSYAKGHMPPHALFLHSISAWDIALVNFMNKMNHGEMGITPKALKEFHETLINAVKQLKSEIPNYSFYITGYGKKKDGTTPHIFFGSPKLLYSDMQDGLSIAKWLCGAIDKDPTDVGESFLK